VPGWVTSGVTGGCVAEFLTLDSVELWTLFEKMGDAIQFDESNGNFFVLLSAAMSEVTGLPDYCSQLGFDLLTGKPVPQTIDNIRGAASPQSGTVLDSVIRPANPAAVPSLFQPVPESQLAMIEKLPFLRQRFGDAVAQVGRRRRSARSTRPDGARPRRRAWYADRSKAVTAAPGVIS
jgi:hypothetical protein